MSTAREKIGTLTSGFPDEARLWIGQAGHEQEMAKKLFDDGFFDGACYYSQQSAEKLLKGVAIGLGLKYPRHHAIHDTALTINERAGQGAVFDNDFLDWCRDLSLLNVQSRYPDGSNAPYLTITKGKAIDALQKLDGIFQRVADWIGTGLAGDQ